MAEAQATDLKQPSEGDAEKADAASAAFVAFNKEIDIDSDKPLPAYDVGRNKAYRAMAKKGYSSGKTLFALVCERHLLPRQRAISTYASFGHSSVLPLVECRKIYWPPAKQERFVFIYEDSLGKVLLNPNHPHAMGWKQERVMDVVVKPMVEILQSFQAKDFVHGSIRPSNMFDGGLGDAMKRIMLGDCLSTPPSYTQPSLYETIERGMADPVGRGLGTLTDDLYSFGVSLAVFLRTHDPLSGMSDEDVIREKIKQGSYAAITGKDRFRGSVLELLRGLLHDDPSQRWTIDEVMVWMDGRRLSPKQALKRKKAIRPFVYGGERYFQAPLLGMALDIIPAETVKVVENETLQQWISRALEDDAVEEKMERALKDALRDGGRGAGYEDRVVANLSAAFDPMAPIRFRGLRVMGDGIGAALYEVIVLKQDVKVFVDLFMQSVALSWVSSTDNPNLDTRGLVTKFEHCRNYLRQKGIGYGLERCLYVLARDTPCLSPLLSDYYVTSPEEMVLAFEDLAKKGDASGAFLDRHSVAFLLECDHNLIEGCLYDLGSSEDHRRIVGNLKCIAAVQKRSKLGNLPGIGKAFVAKIPALLERYNDRHARKKMKDSLEAYAKEGDLSKMASVLENTTLLERDQQAFDRARAEYKGLAGEYSSLKSRLSDDKTFGRATGREFAALASGVLAMIVIIFTAVMFFSGH